MKVRNTMQTKLTSYSLGESEAEMRGTDVWLVLFPLERDAREKAESRRTTNGMTPGEFRGHPSEKDYQNVRESCKWSEGAVINKTKTEIVGPATDNRLHTSLVGEGISGNCGTVGNYALDLRALDGILGKHILRSDKTNVMMMVQREIVVRSRSHVSGIVIKIAKRMRGRN